MNRLLIASLAMLGAGTILPPAPAWANTQGISPAQAETAAPVLLPPAPPAGQILALETDAYRRMTVPVTLNGQGPYRFMVDTGAQATVLSHAVADALQLPDRRMATLVGMASTRQVETALIGEIAFGSHASFDSRAALVTADNIGGADGILGLDSLQDRRVLLDFINRQMEVAHAGERLATRDYDIIVRARQRNGQLIIASATLDGVRVAVLVDTGAQGSLGNAALLRRLRRAAHLQQSEMTDINGVQATGQVRFARSLDFGQAQINNFAVTFAESPTFAALELDDRPALILGMSELHLFERVAIDFPSRRVLFDLPEGAPLPDAEAFRRLAGQ